MPKIPTIKTKFPSPAYIQTKGPMVGSTRRFRYDPGQDGYIHLMKGPDNLWWETEYEPLQGPDLPRDIEKYRQQMIDAMESGNARRKLSRMRAYEAEMAAERERQLFNRRAQAWNEYADMSPAERRYWANRDRLPNTTPRALEEYLMYNPGPYPEIESFDEFSSLYDDLADAPWRY